jgi:hypothetical protein
LDLSVNQDRKQWQPHVIPATQEPEFKWIFTQLSHVKKSDPITNITRDKWLKYNSRGRAWLASGKPWVQIQVSQRKMDRRIEGSQVVDKKKGNWQKSIFNPRKVRPEWTDFKGRWEKSHGQKDHREECPKTPPNSSCPSSQKTQQKGPRRQREALLLAHSVRKAQCDGAWDVIRDWWLHHRVTLKQLVLLNEHVSHRA